MSSAGDSYKGIRSMPNSKKFRDNFEATFGNAREQAKSEQQLAEYKKLEPLAEELHADLKREFCQYCGAGIGEHFREGEGTCRICDPGGKRGFQGMALFSEDEDPRT